MSTEFPFPIIRNGQFEDGIILCWPISCRTCKKKSCSSAQIDKIEMCLHGFNYTRLSEDIIVSGFILSKWQTRNEKARAKAYRYNRLWVIPNEQLNRFIELYSKNEITLQKDLAVRKQELISKYIETNQFKEDFLKELKDDIRQGLSFVHDYKQINMQIGQNINFIIEDRYSGDDFETKLVHATKNEKAIYEASKLLEEKLNIARFLLNSEWLNDKSKCSISRFHGIVHKYLSIYDTKIQQKKLQVKFNGQSFNQITANYNALSIIPHTFIDNAIKYSPKNASIEIFVDDVDDGSVVLKVSSYGPKIYPEDKIYSPFKRGKAAIIQEEEGSGYGLYVCQSIAKNHFNTSITHKQDIAKQIGECSYTTFTVKLPSKCTIAT